MCQCLGFLIWMVTVLPCQLLGCWENRCVPECRPSECADAASSPDRDWIVTWARRDLLASPMGSEGLEGLTQVVVSGASILLSGVLEGRTPV